MIQIINASFLTSAPSIREAEAEGLLEVAFLGRSNVGKSSLINALTNHKNLAKSSSTPGKTRLINFFKVVFKKDEEIRDVHFVDLPGFGYARVSKTQKDEWQKNLTQFISKRLSIRVFLLLIDARHGDLKIDKDVDEYLKKIKKGDQKVIKVFTKVDKLNQKELFALKKAHPNSLCVSVLKKRGIEELKNSIFVSLFGEHL